MVALNGKGVIRIRKPHHEIVDRLIKGGQPITVKGANTPFYLGRNFRQFVEVRKLNNNKTNWGDMEFIVFTKKPLRKLIDGYRHSYYEVSK